MKQQISLEQHLKNCENSGAGEIFINSIDEDGMMNGYDIRLIANVVKNCNLPIIACGGAGNFNHFTQALKNKKIDAVATANLLNFVGDGLQEVRRLIINQGFKLSEWM